MSRLRRLAAGVVVQVIQGRSLDEALASVLAQVGSRDRALLQALCFTAVRWYHRLDFILRQLLRKPIRDQETHALAVIGLAQLAYMAVKPYAVVAETVAAAGRKTWARPLLNALLRHYLRRREELERAADGDDEAAYSHPAWLRRRIETAWPQQAEAILVANNRQPPMTLRVNLAQVSREAYLQRLEDAGLAAYPLAEVASALVLERPIAVEALPGFAEGLVSVQDGAAQLAAPLLDLEPGQRVLDVCAAPGGKTMHILECCPNLGELVAVDIAAERLARVEENLARLGGDLPVRLVCGDGRDPDTWWDGRPFDRILLDVPCSATGVIRRHPDIKLLRRDRDIDTLVQTQRQILEAVWPLLAPGGLLVYVTCSVLPEENELQIRDFVSAHAEAKPVAIAVSWGEAVGCNRQILPGEMDGFYYARLRKCA